MKTRKFGGGGYAAGLEGHIRRGSAKQAREERIKEDKKDAIESVAPELLLAGAPRMGVKALEKVTDKALTAYQKKLLSKPMTTDIVSKVSARTNPTGVARSPNQAGKYREGPELQSPEELKAAQAAARAAKKRGRKAVESPEYQDAVRNGEKPKITKGEEFKIRAGYKGGGYMKKKKSKEGTVMGEFKRGSLKSSSGKKVTNRKQAVAIALSEAGKSKRKK